MSPAPTNLKPPALENFQPLEKRYRIPKSVAQQLAEVSNILLETLHTVGSCHALTRALPHCRNDGLTQDSGTPKHFSIQSLEGPMCFRTKALKGTLAEQGPESGVNIDVRTKRKSVTTSLNPLSQGIDPKRRISSRVDT